MSRYYEAITRPSAPARPNEQGRSESQYRADTSLLNLGNGAPQSLVTLPTLEHVPAAVARAGAIRNLTERLAPLAVIERSTRLLITGCRPGDGASTVATAIAIDLSQRLGLRTILVDAHLRHPSLHRLFQHPGRRTPELMLDGALQIRATEWPRLELVTCCLSSPDSQGQLFDEFETLLGAYPAVIVDLGVTRLDARMLPLARPEDPILMVVRQGHTERRELATTASALRTASRAPAGVILNDATDPVAKPIRRLLGQ
jgi:Mrp family chromosome partitioning ATPase